MIHRHFKSLLLIALALLHGRVDAADLPDPDKDAKAYLVGAAQRLCRAYDMTASEMALLLGRVTVVQARPHDTVVPSNVDRATFRESRGGLLIVDRWLAGVTLERLAAEYHAPSSVGPPRPALRIDLDAQCATTGGQIVRYDETGRADRVDHFGPDLQRVVRSDILNPLIPAGRDRGGVTVALLGTGVDYTVPEIAARLARAPNGQSLGYDFADIDSRPFDLDPRSSPFAPRRRDTAAARVLLTEAPRVRLLPYRYAPAHMERTGEAVEAAAGNGARIVIVTVGGGASEDWEPFILAARAKPHMLFVIAAGDRDRSIDEYPYYPGSANLPNFLVVTAATEDGQIATAANWGRERVELMAPVVPTKITGFDGGEHSSPASVIAAARIGALAARLAGQNPQWQASDLKAAILRLASPAGANGEQRVRHGWISDPDAHPG